MTSRKKPGVAFWATVVVACLMVAYPLSFGPALWMSSHDWCSEDTAISIGKFYYPILALRRSGPEQISSLLDWYAALWIGQPAS